VNTFCIDYKYQAVSAVQGNRRLRLWELCWT